MAGKYGVMSIPSVKLFHKGEVKDEFTGAKSESEVKEFLDKKGQPHTWENLLREANRRYFTPPLSDPEVSKTIKS